MADTTKGLRGLTFESAIAPNPGVANRLGSLQDTGRPNFGRYENEPVTRFRQTMKDIDDQDELLRQMVSWRPSRNQRMQSQREGFLTSTPSEDIGLEAAAAGFGESRFDRKLTSPSQLEDLEDARARQQSTIGVMGNSVAKMGILAATTASDSWLGLPAGVINLITEAFTGNINSGGEALDALINNPVSSYLQGINDKSEEIFKNYQTSEERDRPWWENMFTANFIGDTIIKNAGFTIGAVLGGKAAVGTIGRMTGIREARDAFKGLAAELGLSGKSASEVVELLAKGSTSLEKQAAVKALAESAAKLKGAELGLQIAGGLIAGTGEARIEAINGANEFERAYEDLYGNLDLERAKALDRVLENMTRLGLDRGTPEGEAYYNEQKATIDENYIDLQEQLAHDKAMVANTIFALNVPLLTAGDMIQWGKTMLGGYALDRNVINGVKKATEKTALNAAAHTPEALTEATRYAVKGNKFTKGLEKFGAASRDVFVEAQEEMNQSLFSATAKAKAMGNTTEFMERLYDPMAVADTVSWLDATKRGMQESWLNKEDWVEGFAGGFMGFLGLPSISVKVKENGKQRPSLTMEGGIWSPIREHNELYKQRAALVEALNNRLASPEFLNYYYGKIGNRHFDSIKEDAVRTGDKNLYAKADHAQLINDAMMFSKAGRLQDFIDIIDSFGSVSDGTIEQIKSLFPESNEIQKMTTSGMRTLINDNVERMKRQLDTYMKIADNIKTVYGNAIDDNTAAELAWQTAHLDEIENDLKNILTHPETTAMISAYRAENAEKTKDLTDHEVVSSGAYSTWLTNKYRDKKDAVSKSDLEAAIRDAKDASYDMTERGKYIDNISVLSSDPELIQKRMSRIKKQQEELKRLSKMVKAASVISTTDKLSDFITAMEDLGEDLPSETLADIKKEADRGNVTAKEYLMVKDIDSSMPEQIRRIGEKSGATEEEIKQALDAWNYFKHNSDTAFDLTQKHAPTDIASSVASPKAVALMNEAVEAVMKSRSLYGKIAKRPAKTSSQEKESAGEGTKFKTTGKRLTKERYKEICEDLQNNAGNNSFGATLLRLDLDRANIEFNGLPASGLVYAYYPKNMYFSREANPKPLLPVLFDANGNEISKEDVEKLTGPDGMNLTLWINNENFPVGGIRRFMVETPSLAKKWESLLPVGKKPAKTPTKDTTEKEQDSGTKKQPHKFFAPNMDMSLLGGDSHAVAELLKSLPEGSEVRFGMTEEDGPVYILAGESNLRIGTLPREGEDTDTYSGLAELKSLIRQEFSESKDRRNADGMWVSEKYVNHIREKKDSGFETIDENIPIDEIPGFDGINHPIVMFVTDGKNGPTYMFSDDSVTAADVQRASTIDEANPLKPGFAYLLVPSGKKYIPVMLYTQNVNSETLDLHDPAVTSKGFGKRVSHTIDKVVEAITGDSKTRVEDFKRWALNARNNSNPDSLQRLLYSQSQGKTEVQLFIKETCPQHPGWFVNDDVVMVINRHNKETDEDDWTPISKNDEKSVRDQIIDTLSGMEYETERGETHKGPLAQIHPSHFENDRDNLSTRIGELIESKMLLTDVKGFDLNMPSYILDYWSVSQKKFIRPSHAAAKASSGPVVSTRKNGTRSTEKIAAMELGDKQVQYNLTTNKVKIGTGKWFDAMSSTKAQDAEIKALGFKNTVTFLKTARALATIANKYGDSTTGEDRIGNRVLLRDFTAGKDEGFVLTDKGGRFMSADELVKFKDELKGEKERKAKKKKVDEAERVKKAKADAEELDENDFRQEVGSPVRTNTEEVARMETIHNVRQAIEHLKKYAPQYSGFLDYISGIRYYDEVLVKLADTVDPRNAKTVGQNRFRFREGTFTDTIVVGRNAIGYQTLMHELVHAFTVVALKYDNGLRENVKTTMNFFQDTVGRRKLIDTLGINGMYAFESPEEFVAEFFSNPKLQELAKSTTVPQTESEKKSNIFRRIVNYIADALRHLFRKEAGNFYDKLNDTLYSVVDRQAQLQKLGQVIFKNEGEFNKAKRLASGAKVDGVAMSTKIPTSEERFDYRVSDRSIGNVDLVPSGEIFTGPGQSMTVRQLVADNDEFVSVGGFKRLVNSGNIYQYNSATDSSLYGVRDDYSEAFVAVRAYPASDYSALIRSVSESNVPIIIASHPDEVDTYTRLGLHPVHTAEVGGKVFMANRVFTDEHLYKLGTTYTALADVLDSNSRFSSLRRDRYSDEEWDKLSELEKYHARKCIGI